MRVTYSIYFRLRNEIFSKKKICMNVIQVFFSFKYKLNNGMVILENLKFFD